MAVFKAAAAESATIHERNLALFEQTTVEVRVAAWRMGGSGGGTYPGLPNSHLPPSDQDPSSTSVLIDGQYVPMRELDNSAIVPAATEQAPLVLLCYADDAESSAAEGAQSGERAGWMSPSPASDIFCDMPGGEVSALTCVWARLCELVCVAYRVCHSAGCT